MSKLFFLNISVIILVSIFNSMSFASEYYRTADGIGLSLVKPIKTTELDLGGFYGVSWSHRDTKSRIFIEVSAGPMAEEFSEGIITKTTGFLIAVEYSYLFNYLFTNKLNGFFLGTGAGYTRKYAKFTNVPDQQPDIEEINAGNWTTNITAGYFFKHFELFVTYRTLLNMDHILKTDFIFISFGLCIFINGRK